MSNDEMFLTNSIKIFRDYKKLGEGAIAQVSDAEVMSKPNDASNSIALIVHHISGNMISRWTDLLTTDGEKPWRNRDLEFEESYADKASMLQAWEKGWKVFLDTLDSLKPSDLSTTIYIRNEAHTVMQAIQRQTAHYAMHIGQIIYQAKVIKGDSFTTLSIPKGESAKFNRK
jgi:Protein of unknown function (DUF1572)